MPEEPTRLGENPMPLIQDLRARGLSWAKVAARVGVSRSGARFLSLRWAEWEADVAVAEGRRDHPVDRFDIAAQLELTSHALRALSHLKCAGLIEDMRGLAAMSDAQIRAAVPRMGPGTLIELRQQQAALGLPAPPPRSGRFPSPHLKRQKTASPCAAVADGGVAT